MSASRWSRSFKLALVPFSLIGLTLWFAPWRRQHFVPARLLPTFSYGLKTSHDDTYDTTAPTNDQSSTLPSNSTQTEPGFHVILTNAKRSPGLCRSLLSATILDYPPPILIDYDDGFSSDDDADADDTDPAADDVSESELTQIDRLLRSPDSGIAPQDVVLVADGRATFFHLPARVMQQRFESTRATSNAWAADEYGRAAGLTLHRAPRFEQRVLLGATDQCALNSNNPACRAAPAAPAASTGAGDGEGGLRFPAGGAAIGRAADVQRVYAAASERAAASGAAEDAAATMTRLFAEQETARRTLAASLMAVLRRTPSDSEAAAGSLGMALDYGSALFMSATGLGSTRASHVAMRRLSAPDDKDDDDASRARLPADLASASPPFMATPVPAEADAAPRGTIARPDAALDALPASQSWAGVALATRGGAVPAALALPRHTLPAAADAVWGALWFRPHARAMLRAALRRVKSPAGASAAVAAGRASTARGGLAGAWTADGTWVSVGDVCAGYAAEAFGDGRGEVGGEDAGGRPHCDVNWDLVSGEGDCAALFEEARAAGLTSDEELRAFREGA